jgi:hypothetical protein
MIDTPWVPLSESHPPDDETVLVSVGPETFAGKYVRGEHLEDGIASWLILPSGEDDVSFLAASATHFWRTLPPSAFWGESRLYDSLGSMQQKIVELEILVKALRRG